MIKKLAFIMLFLSTMSLLGCTKSDEGNQQNVKAADKQEAITQGNENKAPNFTLVDTKGKKISLANYRGKVVIIDFWATWCPPCRRGIPDLIDIQKKYKDDVSIIGISLDTDSKSEVPGFIKKFGINYPVVFGTGEVVHEYGDIQAIPTSFLIDQKGNIVDKHIGLTPKSVIVNEIKKLLGKS